MPRGLLAQILLTSLTGLLLAAPFTSVRGDHPLFGGARRDCPTTPYPPETTTTPSPDRPTTTPETALPSERGFVSGRETISLSDAPNMLGNLLGASRSVEFFLNRSQAGVDIEGLGTTNITNSKIGDNNSPQPRDRIGFRFNHFHNALSITGVSDAKPFFDPAIGDPYARRQSIATQDYDVDLYTLSLEKTLFDRFMSVELRLFWSDGLSSNQNLSVASLSPTNTIAPAQVRNPNLGFQFQVPFLDPRTGEIESVQTNDPDSARPRDPRFTERLPGINSVLTPRKSRGNQGGEFGDIALIFKASLYETDNFLVSGGVGVGIPTADDAKITVTDYLGGRLALYNEIQRVREFEIDNDTWTLSPFIAALAVPSERVFVQGFMQVEVPLNDNDYRFSTSFPVIASGADSARFRRLGFTPASAQGEIEEQSLMHVDLGTGYWLHRDPEARWLTGIVPTLELHYTTTLEDADIVTLPSDGSQRRIGAGMTEPAPGPQIGNQRNRVDILDATVGTTFMLADRATLATGFAFPLRDGDDRTFDWEFQIVFNYYFGGLRSR